MEPDRPWPLNALLVRARKARGMSQVEAANAADVSASKWRSIELGYTVPSGGVHVQYDPDDKDVVGAAKAVGLDPAELMAALGREFDESAGPIVREPAALLGEARQLLREGMAKVEAAERALVQRRALE